MLSQYFALYNQYKTKMGDLEIKAVDEYMEKVAKITLDMWIERIQSQLRSVLPKRFEMKVEGNYITITYPKTPNTTVVLSCRTDYNVNDWKDDKEKAKDANLFILCVRDCYEYPDFEEFREAIGIDNSYINPAIMSDKGKTEHVLTLTEMFDKIKQTLKPKTK